MDPRSVLLPERRLREGLARRARRGRSPLIHRVAPALADARVDPALADAPHDMPERPAITREIEAREEPLGVVAGVVNRVEQRGLRRRPERRILADSTPRDDPRARR